jgi:HSP20 family protein
MMLTGLMPFNRRSTGLTNTGVDDFYNFWGDRWPQDRSISRNVFKIDVRETDDKYMLEAELPGIKKDEIDINVDDKMLSISVNREEKADEEKEYYIHKERVLSSMSRTLRLSNANLSDINAKLDNGMLTIDIPKQNKVNEARRIEIQ